MLKNPFGMAASEAEYKILGSAYQHLYFHETPFSDACVDDSTYLIIGRRGSGKTALAQHFAFQQQKANPICIEVGRPEIYQHVLSEISKRTSQSRVIAVGHLRRVWEFVIWSLIAQVLNAPAHRQDVRTLETRAGKMSLAVARLIEVLLRFFDGSSETTIGPALERVVDDANLGEIQRTALEAARSRPIFLAVDTIEQYEVENTPLMYALAALIEYAADFNLIFARQNIHLKVFVGGEVFPHLKEAVLLSAPKAVRDPVYLLWNQRDMLRLICWRFYRFLISNAVDNHVPSGLDWDNESAVLEQVWIPYFGRVVTNSRGIQEESWSYVLRHTQMRPRQLILICNCIANRALAAKHFPVLSPEDIVHGTREAEIDLAAEILNSYSAIHPGVEQIIGSLMRLPMEFEGRELDVRAEQSAAESPRKYPPAAFRKLVAELGVIGRVTKSDEASGFIYADFEYSLKHRLYITPQDHCVVHPMFYQRLQVSLDSPSIIIPYGIG